MTDSTQADKTARRRSRGTGFPVVSLGEATEVVKELGKYGKEHALGAVATAAGHTTTNSGAFKAKIAAYRDYGLMAGTGDVVALTDLGWRVAHPEDDTIEHSAFREAFLKPEVFAKLYGDLVKDQTLTTENLGNKAVQSYKVSAGSKVKFVRSFVDSAVTAGLATEEEPEKVRFVELEAPQPGAHVDHGELDGGEEHEHGKGDRRRRGDEAPVVLRQVWPVARGEVTIEIRSNEALEAKTFGVVGELIAKGEELAGRLGHGDER